MNRETYFPFISYLLSPPPPQYNAVFNTIAVEKFRNICNIWREREKKKHPQNFQKWLGKIFDTLTCNDIYGAWQLISESHSSAPSTLSQCFSSACLVLQHCHWDQPGTSSEGEGAGGETNTAWNKDKNLWGLKKLSAPVFKYKSISHI